MIVLIYSFIKFCYTIKKCQKNLDIFFFPVKTINKRIYNTNIKTNSNIKKISSKLINKKNEKINKDIFKIIIR